MICKFNKCEYSSFYKAVILIEKQHIIDLLISSTSIVTRSQYKNMLFKNMWAIYNIIKILMHQLKTKHPEIPNFPNLTKFNF